MEKKEDQQLSLEEKLQEVEAKLKSVEGEKEKFFNIISFWLGSPLNSLKMLSDMLLSDVDRMDKDGVVEFNKHLNNQIQKLHSLMHNLIDWSSLEVGNYTVSKSVVDLKSVFYEVLKNHLAHAQKKTVTINNNIQPGINVLADKKMLKSVLSNLISNAIKFCRKEDSITINAEKTASTVKIVISDTGIGMGKAKMANIFNPARKSTQKGTAQEEGFGIGMILIKTMLGLHDTELELDSTQGKGTVVSFTLPEGEA